MALRQLSRLSITGLIHHHTPLCVLIEIADAHGINYDLAFDSHPNFAKNLIKSINETSAPDLSDVNSIEDWQCIARYVNKHSSWPQQKLRQAYNFLINFITTKDPLELIPEDFSFGLQTPSNIFSVNACVLYKTCLYHRLNVTQHTTINQMAFAVKMLREEPDSLQRRALSFVKDHAKKMDLINVLMLSHEEIIDPDPPEIFSGINYNKIPPVDTNSNYQMLELIHNSLVDVKQLQFRVDPTTHCGAIALAATLFGIDISKSGNPVKEYKLLKLTGRNSYVPSDPWLKYWYYQNNNIFDLSETFNPLFPESYYSSERLRKMAELEGYIERDFNTNTVYELMQLAYITETFYLGKYPNMSSDTTCIMLDDVEDITYGELLCYGELSGDLKPISIEELTDMFRANKNFANPFVAETVFQQRSIRKLKEILRSIAGPIHNKPLSDETTVARRTLLELIESIEFSTRYMDDPTRDLCFTYNNASRDTKILMVKTLTQLLHIGMYMRGWIGPGHDYPVIRAPVPSERECEVTLNVTTSIADFESSCRLLGKIGNKIKNLPLVKYCDGQYQLSNNSNDGLTIGERIEIIKLGDITNNIASCIRLSSNWICSSAHKYLMGIGQSSPFDIFHLRHIS